MLQELELLDEDSNIFKLVGPILVKQDPLEATTNVKKRLEFIKGEVDRLDAQLKRLEDKQSKRQHTVSLRVQFVTCNIASSTTSTFKCILLLPAASTCGGTNTGDYTSSSQNR